MALTEEDRKLVELASALVGERKVTGGVIREVGSALMTKGGRIFTGASMDLGCGIGFCAEHAAIANMVSHCDETEIQAIVAVGESGILPPCGRCRELMELIDIRNRDETRVIISDNETSTLGELLPRSWLDDI